MDLMKWLVEDGGNRKLCISGRLFPTALVLAHGFNLMHYRPPSAANAHSHLENKPKFKVPHGMGVSCLYLTPSLFYKQPWHFIIVSGQ